MDPLTQGLLGAAVAQPLFGKKLKHAWLIGAAGGMAPDLDVLIRSSVDPLMAIEYHRHFTHSLAFIPLGGAIAALPFLLRKTLRDNAKAVIGASIAGFATHGLLDSCTTYGTQLFWPFSNTRVAFSWISIIDPVFTFALLIGLFVGAMRKSAAPVIAGLVLAVAYMGLGAFQHQRALGVQEQLASLRGHERVRGDVFPTLANQWVWRSLYESDGKLYADRIRVSWTGETQWSGGTSLALLRKGELAPEIVSTQRLSTDFDRFKWFSAGWIARAPDDPSIIGDVRYSLRTDAFQPIWGIRLIPGEAPRTEWVNRTGDRNLRLENLWDEITGEAPDYAPL